MQKDVINNSGTFSELNPKAKFFEELRAQQPKWWTLFSKDNELYIDIRKDNSINVYYYGGSVAKINYSKSKKSFVATIHQKYLGDDKPRGRTPKGKDKFEKEPLDLENLNETTIADIKKRIKNDYVRHINNEKIAEKWIQGKMIKENPNYVDSEFQYNKNSEKLRIDLIELSEGILSFVELKNIFNKCLWNDPEKNLKKPAIIDQMEKYQSFINKHETDLLDYYKKLIEIKNSLGLTKIDYSNITLNKIPKLIIANTYKKDTRKRQERILNIENLLKSNSIDYKIIKL